MSETAVKAEPRRATPAVRGQLHKFLPLPIMPHHALWFETGPLTFGLEGRVIDDETGGASERSASIHIFNNDRVTEYVRFDCFARFPHYHYILNPPQHNIVWGYDPDMNGPMLPWALNAIRNRLPTLLRRAGEPEHADRVERDGFDHAVLDRIEQAVATWPSTPAKELMAESVAWYDRWKKLHPQFNTAD